MAKENAGLVLEDSGMTDAGKTWEVDHHFEDITYWYVLCYSRYESVTQCYNPVMLLQGSAQLFN